MNRFFQIGLILLLPICGKAQLPSVMVDIGSLEGLELTPANVFNYRIINHDSKAKDVTITGTIRYRNSGMRASYVFDTKLYPGSNQFSTDKVRSPQWNFSVNALKELFFYYSKLPQGTYEYCVSVSLKKVNAEQYVSDPVDDCIYQTVNDIFLINLLSPDNDAKIYEHYPMLTWVVNYPFASALTYRVRVVRLKKGQNNENAITRNNPVFQDKNVLPTNLMYPVTAKPLQVFQPYVWTVDAYYKGILLGGAEPWKFTIIEDSVLKPKYVAQSYYEFEKHMGETRLYAYGVLKLKYNLDGASDTLIVRVVNKRGKEIKVPDKYIPVVNGSNYIDVDLFERASLKHNQLYTMYIKVKGKQYSVPFTYINPLYTK